MSRRPAKKSAPSRSLKELDPNFKNQTGSDGLRWVDAFDRRVALRGLGWLAENRRTRGFRRFPDRVEPRLSGAVSALSHCPAGVFLSFLTDSPDLSVRWELADLEWMENMPPTGCAGVELFVRQNGIWQTVAVGRPALADPLNIRALLTAWPGERREYRLYFPLYKRIKSLAIGISATATISPVPAARNSGPIVFYGTSITQGGCANTAGSDFVSSLGRLWDREVLNFGFSGNGKGERAIAEILREIPAAAFVLDYVANVDAAQLQKTLPPFVNALREHHPEVPVILVGQLPFDRTLWNATARKAHDDCRHVMMRFYLSRKDRNLHFIDGNGLLPTGRTGIYTDGVHPTGYGFAVMTDRLDAQIRNLLPRV